LKEFNTAILRRKAIERRQFVRALHPTNALGDLDVRASRNGLGIVIGCALDVDDARQHFLIDVKEAGAAIRAEMPPAVL
jgi:hypothetical protein